MSAVIHYRRINRPEAIHNESKASDDGVRLDTESVLSEEVSRRWSRDVWQKAGVLREDQFIVTVRKHLFYLEWFGVMELRGGAGELLGFYCDLLTPLEQRDGEYYTLDLMLDLWILPDGTYKELDWEEFEEAARQGLITEEHQQVAADTLRRMVAGTRAGTFPWAYLPQNSQDRSAAGMP